MAKYLALVKKVGRTVALLAAFGLVILDLVFEFRVTLGTLGETYVKHQLAGAGLLTVLLILLMCVQRKEIVSYE